MPSTLTGSQIRDLAEEHAQIYGHTELRAVHLLTALTALKESDFPERERLAEFGVTTSAMHVLVLAAIDDRRPASVDPVRGRSAGFAEVMRLARLDDISPDDYAATRLLKAILREGATTDFDRTSMFLVHLTRGEPQDILKAFIPEYLDGILAGHR